MAFLRSKQSDDPAGTGSPTLEPDPSTSDAESRKGRPTPRRKEAEAANRRPLVAGRTSTGRGSSASRSEAKAAQREMRRREYDAMKSGDERYLPAKDKGAERRFARDWVDARWNVGEFFLPVALVLFVAMIATSNTASPISVIVLMALYLMVVVAVVDAFFMWRGLRKRLTAKFGTVTRGTAMYAVMRGFQLRRFRLPKPTSPKHGSRPV